MDRDVRHRRFLAQLVLVFTSISALAAGANYLIDPYGLFNSPRIDGINARKPAAAERIRVSKPYMASAEKPRTVIGGNSRPEIGIDPQSTCWSPEDRSVFNMGIPGASLHMQTQYVKHAVIAGDATRVFMGLDFFDFLLDKTKPRRRVDWTTLASSYAGRLDIPGEDVSALHQFAQRAKDRFNGLLSLETLGDTILTIASQGVPFPSDRRSDGFNPADDYVSIIRNEGQHVLFAQKNREVAFTLTRPNLGLFNLGNHSSEDFDALKNFLAWAADRKFEVTLFINPYHAHYLALIDLTGKWPLFEQWKRELSRLAAVRGVTLWDFNSVDAYSTETPPAIGDRRSQMRWYWEPAHYRAELGEVMIAQMKDLPCGSATRPSRLGTRLNPETIEAHLARLSTDLASYKETHPQEIKTLRALTSDMTAN